MRILLVIDRLESGGAQRQLVELALGFQEKGHNVSFLTYHNSVFYLPVLEKAQIQIVCIQESNYVLRLFKMRRYIRKGNYDAVISFLEAANFISEFAGFPARKWKLLVGERSANPHIVTSLRLKFFRWFHLFADYVVANSATNIQMVRSINHCLPEIKCKVIYNAVDQEKFKPIAEYVPRRNGKLNILIAASHRSLKNLRGLIESIKLLDKTERSQLRVDWYGDRLEVPFFDNSIVEARQNISDSGLDQIITFHPATNDIITKMQQADVVALFSYYEGFPNLICEGMACSKPVICSAISDIPDVLTYDNKVLFDPCDVHTIKNAIRYILRMTNDQLVEIGKMNLLIASDKFNKDNIVGQYLDLLKN